MESVHDLLDALRDPQPDSLLATILAVKGSSYRKAGAMMLVRQDGSQVGLLSPGCMEADLAARAGGIMSEGKASAIVYDMSAEDDLSWGEGAGCNGVIHVLAEPLDERLRFHLNRLRTCLEQGMSASLAKRLRAEGRVIEYAFVTEQGESFGTWDGEIPDAVTDALLQRKNGLHTVGGMEGVLYTQHFQPQPRLVIFGAGRDARPLAELAARCGYLVMVADWRPALCDRAFFPGAKELVLGRPTELLERIQLTPRDHIILMTHHFQNDRELLRSLLQQNVPYLGVLGPRSRTTRLLEGEAIPPHVRSPAGLPIDAVGAEEIAVSIMADVIAHARSQCQ